MGKVLIQVGASEEARSAAAVAAAAGAPAPALVLPRSNVPEEVKPVEEEPEQASSSEGAAEAAAEVRTNPRSLGSTVGNVGIGCIAPSVM